MFILDINKQHLINLDQVISIDVNENKIEARIIKGNDIIAIPLITYNFSENIPFTLPELLCYLMDVINHTDVTGVIDINIVFNEYTSKKPYQEFHQDPNRIPMRHINPNHIVPINHINNF